MSWSALFGLCLCFGVILVFILFYHDNLKIEKELYSGCVKPDPCQDYDIEDMSSAVLKQLDFRSSYAYKTPSQSAIDYDKNKILIYREYVKTLPSRKMRQAYYKWLDYYERRLSEISRVSPKIMALRKKQEKDRVDAIKLPELPL